MGKLLAFGEIMLRLSSPGRELLLQTPRFDVWIAGAEANVVTQLARLGHDVGIATRVPDNDLGQAAITTLRGHGVDTGGIQRAGDRMGLYFVASGAGMRATEVVYDRAHSAFAETPVEAWDWDALLANVDRLHLSGITPALGPVPAQSALAAVEAAAARGIAISFDGNWRAKLWERWDSNPRRVLSAIVAHADLMFGNYQDVALLLDRTFTGTGEARRREAAAAAFDAYPKLQMLASTARYVEHVDLHRLSARVETRYAIAQTGEVEVAGIVDRIGGGDAFAAGVLHALRCEETIDATARIGLAMSVLKHSLPGDAALLRQTDIDRFLTGGLDIRR